MSEKITRPEGAVRSRAPNAIRPSPVPTSSSVSPGPSRALSRTASRSGYRNSVSVRCLSSASPPKRTSTSHRNQRSGPSATTTKSGPPARPATRPREQGRRRGRWSAGFLPAALYGRTALVGQRPVQAQPGDAAVGEDVQPYVSGGRAVHAEPVWRVRQQPDRGQQVAPGRPVGQRDAGRGV